MQVVQKKKNIFGLQIIQAFLYIQVTTHKNHHTHKHNALFSKIMCNSSYIDT